MDSPPSPDGRTEGSVGAGEALRPRLPGNSGYTDLDGMREWARGVMQRKPDFVIGDDYLRRWWIAPRNQQFSVYLHEILHSDDDRALHDHPWRNTSFVLEGRYVEHTPERWFLREAGSLIERPAEALHRLEILPGERALTVFLTGPVEREWGFSCPQGWRHWREFVDTRDTGKIGRGCGEHSEP